MKKQTSFITLGLMLATPAFAGGGGAPAAPAPAGACKTIAQIVAGDPNFSTLATALNAAGLTQTLQSGQYTVFAPTNAAFAKLPSDTLAAALNDTEMLKTILLYHVVPGKVSAAQVKTSTSVNTVQGSGILVTVNGAMVMLDNARVTRADVAACNGVVHIIDTVLMPAMEAAAPAPAAEAPAAEAPAAPAPEAPAAEAPAAEAPAAEAPAAEAPAAEAPAAEAAPAAGAPAAADFMAIPALPLSGATTTATTTTTDTSTTTTTGTTDTAATTDTATTTDTAATTETATTTETTTTEAAPAAETTEAVATNTLYDVILNDDRFSTLRDLLSDAGLTDVLMNNEYTVFAPTNAAFEAVDPDQLALIASDPETLKKVLLYHVVSGKQTAEQIGAVAQLASAEGGSLDLKMDGTTQMVGAAKVEGAPLEASNGNIFVIDKVLLPPNLVLPAPPAAAEPPAAEAAPAAAPAATPAATAPAATAPAATTTTTTTATVTTTPAAATLVELLQGQPQFSTLVSLITKAGLVDTLLKGDYTVFAPTNDAFAKVPQATLDMLNADPAKLKQVLLFHVVSGRVVDDGLKVAQLRSAEGSSIDLQADGTSYKVGVLSGTTLTGGMLANTAPLTAGNSVVYTLDTVLIPPTLK